MRKLSKKVQVSLSKIIFGAKFKPTKFHSSTIFPNFPYNKVILHIYYISLYRIKIFTVINIQYLYHHHTLHSPNNKLYRTIYSSLYHYTTHRINMSRTAYLYIRIHYTIHQLLSSLCSIFNHRPQAGVNGLTFCRDKEIHATVFRDTLYVPVTGGACVKPDRIRRANYLLSYTWPSLTRTRASGLCRQFPVPDTMSEVHVFGLASDPTR